jgi:hypothetical protein
MKTLLNSLSRANKEWMMLPSKATVNDAFRALVVSGRDQGIPDGCPCAGHRSPAARARHPDLLR